MVFMRVREHDAAKIGNGEARLSQAGSQSLDCLLGLRPRIDDRDRIFRDEINVDRADIERGGQRDGDDLHIDFRSQISNLKFQKFKTLKDKN
jgi:hypothetical protein